MGLLQDLYDAAHRFFAHVNVHYSEGLLVIENNKKRELVAETGLLVPNIQAAGLPLYKTAVQWKHPA